MSSSNKNKHLSFEERVIIETGIRNGSSKKSIADTLGKDKSTIGNILFYPKSAIFLSNAQIIRNVNLAEHVKHPALIIFLLPVQEETELLALVMAVLKHRPVILTIINTILPLLNMNTNRI